VKLEFWHTQTQDNKKVLEAMVERFNTTNGQGISVNLLGQQDYTNNNRNIMLAIQSRTLPDITVAYPSMIADYMKAKVLAPAEEFVDGKDGLTKESLADIFPAYLDDNRHPFFENRLLSFPFTKSVLCTYTNDDVLKAAGKAIPGTWDEFSAAVLAATDPAAAPPRKGLVMEVNPSTLDGWIYSNGGKLLAADNKHVRFDEPAAVELFARIGDLFKRGAAYQVPKDEYQQDFGAGRAAMFCGSSTRRDLVGRAVSGHHHWSIANIPQKDVTHPVTVLYGANICIFRSSPEKEKAAWAFIKWLTEREQAAEWSTKTTYMPLRKSVAQSPVMKAAWQKDPQGYQAFQLLPFAVPEPQVGGWQEVRDILKEAMVAVITGKSTAQAAMKDAAQKANAVLAG
jgi:ABC-type glycerol-3-phosphate transport system substrate-binding protein